MFEVTGETTYPGGDPREATAAWDDGVLTGDPYLISLADLLVSRRETVDATPTGPSREAAYQPEEDAAILVASFFQRIIGWTGDFPEGIFDHEGVA